MGRLLLCGRGWGFAVGFGGFSGFVEGAGGVFVGLAGEFVGGESALAVRGSGSGMGVGG